MLGVRRRLSEARDRALEPGWSALKPVAAPNPRSLPISPADGPSATRGSRPMDGAAAATAGRRTAGATMLCTGLLVALAWLSTLSYYGSFFRGWDAQLYYAHLRSAVIDGDLNATNEVRELTPGLAVFAEGRGPWGGLPVNAEGQLVNVYTVGSSLAGLPGFMLGHAIAMTTGQPTDGYSRPYEFGVTLWYGLLVVMGSGLIALVLSRWFGPKTSIAAAVGIVAGTNTLHYAAVMPLMNHATSFFAVSLLLWLSVKLMEQPMTKRWWGVAGVATFFIVLTRPTDAVMLVLLCPPAWRVILQGWKPAVIRAWPTLLGIAAGIALQLVVWRLVFGRWVTNAYTEWTGGRGFDLTQPHWLELLFSGQGGWLMHPLFAVATVGLILAAVSLRGQGRTLAGMALLGLVLQLGLYGCWVSWESGAGFGNRIFINTAPLAALGLAWALSHLAGRARWRQCAAAGALAVFLAWNGLLMWGYRTGTLPDRTVLTPASLIGAQADTLQALIPGGGEGGQP